MTLASGILIALVALLHLYFLYFEMFAWTTRGRKVFLSLPPELFEPTKPMAANQGLYNGFLAAGLVWSLVISDAGWKDNIALFFLSCAFIAGVFGALTVQKKIFFVQSLPALIAGLLVLFK